MAYAFFLFYIGISLALMNLVTAVVVETSLKKTAEDEEYQQQLFEVEVQKTREQVVEMFRCLDENENGVVEKEEFVMLGPEQPVLGPLLRNIGICTEDEVADFFDFIDHDKDEALSIPELMKAVRNLQGVVSNFGALAVIKCADTVKERLDRLNQAIEGLPDTFSERVFGIEKMLSEVLTGERQLCTIGGQVWQGQAEARKKSTWLPDKGWIRNSHIVINEDDQDDDDDDNDTDSQSEVTATPSEAMKEEADLQREVLDLRLELKMLEQGLEKKKKRILYLRETLPELPAGDDDPTNNDGVRGDSDPVNGDSTQSVVLPGVAHVSSGLAQTPACTA